MNHTKTAIRAIKAVKKRNARQKEAAAAFVDKVLGTEQRQKDYEMVNAVVRYIVVASKNRVRGEVVELEVQLTRRELALLQRAHAKDQLMLNYVKEID